MPSRVIREGLLDSPRYWSVTLEARQLFWHLMLLADDFGLVSLAPVFIRRRCFDDAPAPTKIDKLIEQLADADLIRIYGDGEPSAPGRYAFIPRFGQRLRLMRCKHPMPPAALFDDDADAKKLFNENRHKFKNPPATRQPHARQMTDTRRPEVELESKGKESMAAPANLEAWAAHAGIVRSANESDEQFRRRASAAWARAISAGGT